jgi:hypothetical protein
VLLVPVVIKLFASFSEIRKIPNDDKVHEDDGSVYYLHDINTKYYNTQIALCAVETTESLPAAIRSSIEGVLIYFDSNDVSLCNLLLEELQAISSLELPSRIC